MGDATNGTNGIGGASHTLPALVTSASTFLEQDYDYVIIGGGTAGLVLAARLTENPDEGTGGLVHNIARGKVLGGSSGINYMMYVRGSERDYDDWAVLADDPGWGFANMRQYITKHQTLEPIPDSITNRVAMSTVDVNHGTSGPIHTSFNDTRLDIEDAFILGADQASGITQKPVDAWGGDHYGFYNGLGSVYRTGPLAGKRSYAARGYFEANASRPNLKVLCEAPVSSIILDADNRNAVGVAFTHGGERHEVRARREVLLCAGAIQSPQVLELSGIGKPEVLRKAGVEVKVDLPSVGENFQDHVVAGVGYELAPGIISGDSLWHPDAMAEAQKALMEHALGPLTATASGQGFVSYKQLATEEELNETIASIRETQKTSSPFQRRQLDLIVNHLEDDRSANVQYILIPAKANLSDESIMDQSKMWLPGNPEKPQIVWGCALQYPVSRGSVHITSADPTAPPNIDPSYLSHPADVAVLASGMKLADRIANSPALAPLLGARTSPAPGVDLQQTAAAAAAVRAWSIGEYHVAGGCAMGDTVDSKLRVKGVGNLRVVDASVFPNHVSGNCQSSVYALAERAADLVKEAW
ncbi:Aryl-alcohol dehydrogenase [Lasiodiplodia theobromae]|uniref:Dehydrogenase patE n=1 Tax=Lasiodiplodia theobromae TaxID=45133 RepID=A0A5N5CZD3_9PEZI|nr:Aryl-alcohol dehydrogenase [Lasiodiplodia theobromae]KAB2570740.1 Dehydrogenase patE [Lasiodiplodia theobromae]KAF4535142.1 Aryl-alcohol dehydrogenase [Lasiodiplodia theobromae]